MMMILMMTTDDDVLIVTQVEEIDLLIDGYNNCK